MATENEYIEITDLSRLCDGVNILGKILPSINDIIEDEKEFKKHLAYFQILRDKHFEQIKTED